MYSSQSASSLVYSCEVWHFDGLAIDLSLVFFSFFDMDQSYGKSINSAGKSNSKLAYSKVICLK